MAEQKKKGFHALEKRIHEIEAEDAKREEETPRSAERRAEGSSERRSSEGTEGPTKK
jgi:hypothetical protein